jgi:hypothetical protein
LVITIVTTTYRYKRPRKRKAVAIAGPAVVRKRAAGPVEPRDQSNAGRAVTSAPATTTTTGAAVQKTHSAETEQTADFGAASTEVPPQPANDGRKPPAEIVTARRPGARRVDVPDLTPEEYQRRGEAADALWRELVRRATGKDRL